ncbi:MAG: ABC transporter ATP-binding protein, partial [Clostridium sp.]
MALLEIENLKTYFDVDGKKCTAVDGISFAINKGKTIAVIGESGSGKSVTALSIMGLIDYPGKIADGKIVFNGEDLLKKKEKDMRKIRGNDIAMIYQDPMTTLNPMIKVGEQIGEALIIHKKNRKIEIKSFVIDLMKSVGIMDAEERYNQLPEQFSGGMRQRLMIAMAIACKPKLLIAD